MDNKKIDISFNLCVQYTYIDNSSTQLLVLLHGYGQNKESFYKDLVKKLTPELLSNFNLIIPNAPFPIPKVRNGEILYRFAWYFYNHLKSEYYIDMSSPISMLSQLISEVGADTTTHIIGYSQGGYLAPILASFNDSIDTTTSINANTRVDKLGNFTDFNHLSIHNKGDQIVDFENSFNSHNELVKKITKAHYTAIEGGSHEIDDGIISTIEKRLEELLETF